MQDKESSGWPPVVNNIFIFSCRSYNRFKNPINIPMLNSIILFCCMEEHFNDSDCNKKNEIHRRHGVRKSLEHGVKIGFLNILYTQ